ncbi:MAG: acyl-CoA thioesterase [Candidatus Lokiarchaeota archaeon]|nr:acyl-CoA thioesterase [Candidatus Lokiarchaeota archaeon]MBD3337787.1 acyl-CoA thioesterase [Candidatus Lokiarchaeota archaeon]
MNEELNNFRVIIEVPIAWGDMDAFQHVNNIMFFRYLESARIAYFEKIGFLEYMKKAHVGPILASTECKYIAPLQYPDTILVGAKTNELNIDRFQMKYTILSKGTNKIAALGKALVICYDYKNRKKVSLPERIKNRIIHLDKPIST